jgi:hypothetical protein
MTPSIFYRLHRGGVPIFQSVDFPYSSLLVTEVSISTSIPCWPGLRNHREAGIRTIIGGRQEHLYLRSINTSYYLPTYVGIKSPCNVPHGEKGQGLLAAVTQLIHDNSPLGLYIVTT